MKILYNLSYHLVGIAAIIAVYMIIAFQWISKKLATKKELHS